MKTLSLEEIQKIDGGACPWWGGVLIESFFIGAAILSGPGAPIIAAGGFIAGAAYDYACSKQQ